MTRFFHTSRRLTAGLALALTLSACGGSLPGVRAATPSAGGFSALGDSLILDPIFAVPPKAPITPTRVFAHRGFSTAAPENTLSAVRAALDAGADGVEFDVRLTKDGTLVLMHDDDVERTTNGKGAVEDQTLEALRRLDAGSAFSPAFKGEPIPTLDEVLALINGRAEAVIEIKHRTSKEVPVKLAEALVRHGMQNQSTVISFYETPLIALRKILPNQALGALVAPPMSPTERSMKMGASIAMANQRAIGTKQITQAHALGLRIYAWTVNDPRQVSQLAAAGIDGLITDDVVMTRSVLAAQFRQPGPAPVVTPAPAVTPGPELY